MSLAQNFIAAYGAGQDLRDRRQQRNALMSASQQYGAGNVTGARNALLGAGLINEANAYRQMGEQDREDQYRTARTTALQGAGDDWRKQLEALSGAAVQFGNADDLERYRGQLADMDDETRQRTAAASDAFGALGMGFVTARTPDAQRQQQALASAEQIAQRTGLSVEAVQQMIQSQTDWSDQGLIAMAGRNASALDLLNEHTRKTERTEDIRREDRQFNQRLGAARASTAGGFDPTNPNGVRVSAEQRGRVALSFQNIVSAQNQLAAIEQAAGGDTPYGKDWGARMLEGIPWDGGSAARIAGGEDYTAYETASKTFEQSVIPIFAGSAVTESEAKRFVRSNLPRFGDTPAILEQKAANRARIINAAAGILGAPAPFPDVGVWESAAPTTPAETRAATDTATSGRLQDLTNDELEARIRRAQQRRSTTGRPVNGMQ